MRLLPIPASIVTADGIVVDVNSALLEMTGLESAPLMGRPLTAMVEEPAEKISSYLLQCANSAQAIPGRITWKSSDGRAIAARSDGGAISDSTGESLLLLTFRAEASSPGQVSSASLAAQVESLSREIEARERVQTGLEASLRTRDEFLSAAAHELRNPINALHLTLNTLQMAAGENALPDPAKLELRIVRAATQVKRLAGLIEHMIDVSRLYAGRIRFETEKFDLVSLVRAVIDRSAEKHDRASIALDGVSSLPMFSDRIRLEQVFIHLLSNAIKYGEGKPIAITVTADDGRAAVEVEDHGLGIAPIDHERIFLRFERASNARPDSGFGVGLWIARQIVTGLGGQIQLRSQPGAGSAFRVELPVTQPAIRTEGREVAS